MSQNDVYICRYRTLRFLSPKIGRELAHTLFTIISNKDSGQLCQIPGPVFKKVSALDVPEVMYIDEEEAIYVPADSPVRYFDRHVEILTSMN